MVDIHGLSGKRSKVPGAPKAIVNGIPQDRRIQPRPKLAEIRHGAKRSLISPVVTAGILRVIELLLLALLGYLIYVAYVSGGLEPVSSGYLFAAAFGAAATNLVFQGFDLYSTLAYARFALSFTRVAAAWSIVFAAMTVVAFFFKIGEEYSRVWLASWYLAGLFFLLIYRLVAYAALRVWAKQGRLDRRAVIVGGGPAGEELIKALEASHDTDIRICGVFDDRGENRVSSLVAGYPKLGRIEELVEFGRQSRIDLLIVSLPITAENRLLEILKQLWVLPVDIRLSAHTNRLRFSPRTYSYIGNVPFIDVLDKPIADWDFLVKWVFDKSMAALLLLLLSPLMGLIALAVRLDSKGPILFKQKRHGFNNELIEVYKFRSMRTDMADHAASKLVTRDDPRVTRVGRFLRRTSLDELPQFLNVILGNLSIVGPRPHALQAKAADQLYHDVVDGYFARHRVKPGITGWAQINGWRGETDTEEKIQRRVEHDLYYIENWSVAFDLLIMLKTPYALFRARNAY